MRILILTAMICLVTMNVFAEIDPIFCGRRSG